MTDTRAEPPGQPSRPFAPDDLAYVERVRRATARLGAREVAPDDIRGALDAVRDLAHFDVEVPATSPRREVRMVKTGVKRLSAWYMRYLAAQLDSFGLSVLRLGDAVAARTERLEGESAELGARLGELEQRVRRLEEGR